MSRSTSNYKDGNNEKVLSTESKGWRRFLPNRKTRLESMGSSISSEKERPPEKWSMGILNDRKTEEVPGTILLLSARRNEPLGMRHATAHHSSSSLPSPFPSHTPTSERSSRSPRPDEKKKTADGQMILDPQPDDSLNDPLNWPAWRRDSALLSLGFYCMLGGGLTPVLAAGFQNVADDYDVTYAKVALTTGLYMMGLGVGCVIFSPTAILFGKRPVYLGAAIMLVLTSIWCAASPNYASLATARVFQGIAHSLHGNHPKTPATESKSPLHEGMTPRQDRLHRRNIHVEFADSEIEKHDDNHGEKSKQTGGESDYFPPVIQFDGTSAQSSEPQHVSKADNESKARNAELPTDQQNNEATPSVNVIAPERSRKPDDEEKSTLESSKNPESRQTEGPSDTQKPSKPQLTIPGKKKSANLSLGKLPSFGDTINPQKQAQQDESHLGPSGVPYPLPDLRNFNSPYYLELERNNDYLSHHTNPPASDLPKIVESPKTASVLRSPTDANRPTLDGPKSPVSPTGPRHFSPSRASHDVESGLHSGIATPLSQKSLDMSDNPPLQYTHNLKSQPPKTFTQTLRPWSGRLSKSHWFKVMLRPFVLYLYPAVLWSALVYALSVGWLIVLSESVSSIYRNKESYNFSALGTGLVYISPFIGGVLGTAVAGKVSDIIVRYMSRRNGGVYEPEFRLVMAIPVAISTAIGLMGFGWSAQERDKWIVPTVFFGIISFGCSLGSTTAITFCVDSYRQYAGEALVTLNVAKNIFHGLVFSLFFADWLESDGPKNTFLAIGGIQIACLITTVPMYIWGKKARMWTVRKKLMEKL
ncbi:MAG: hypothetical protein Q9160_006087 [Pyrenula sp. 1 TL-2023]